MTNKKGKQVTFTYQLPSQATANLRNQGASSSYPHRPQLSEMVSSIMMNSLPIKKRDSGAPMIMSEIGGMSFTRSLLDTGASINILPKDVFDRHHVWELQPFLVELCLADGSLKKPHGLVEDVIMRIEDCYFL